MDATHSNETRSSSRGRRVFAALAVALGVLSVVVATAIQWLLGGGSASSPVEVASGQPQAWLAMGMLWTLGLLVWIGGLPRVAGLAAGRGSGIAWFGALATGAGLAAGIGHLAMFYGLFNTIASSGVDGAAQEALMNAADGALGTVLLIVFLLGFTLGPIILAVGLRVGRVVGVWVPLVGVVAAAAMFVDGPVAALVQYLSLIALWCPIVVALLRTRTFVPVAEAASARAARVTGANPLS